MRRRSLDFSGIVDSGAPPRTSGPRRPFISSSSGCAPTRSARRLEVAHQSIDVVQRVRFPAGTLAELIAKTHFSIADARVTLGYRLSKWATFQANEGVEAMLGRTHVTRIGNEVAAVPHLRGVVGPGSVPISRSFASLPGADGAA